MTKKFKNKFNLMVEQAVERFQQGGYINGDYVKFVSNIKSSEFFKKQSEQIQNKIIEMMDSDLHIRVSAIKSTRFPQNRVDGGLNAASDFYIDVVTEYAPGLYKDPVTVPAELIELVDTPDAMGRMTPPDSTVYKANIHGAEELKSDDENRSNPKKDTKIAGGSKWVDKPGGGGGDGMKPIKENKDDVSALTEAYESIYKKDIQEEGKLGDFAKKTGGKIGKGLAYGAVAAAALGGGNAHADLDKSFDNLKSNLGGLEQTADGSIRVRRDVNNRSAAETLQDELGVSLMTASSFTSSMRTHEQGKVLEYILSNDQLKQKIQELDKEVNNTSRGSNRAQAMSQLSQIRDFILQNQ